MEGVLIKAAYWVSIEKKTLFARKEEVYWKVGIYIQLLNVGCLFERRLWKLKGDVLERHSLHSFADCFPRPGRTFRSKD